MRLGLRALLSDSGIEVIGEADRLDPVAFGEAEADVLIYASASAPLPPFARMEGGSAAFLLLSDEPPSVQSMARSAAAWGSLPLEASREELVAAIHALSEGLVVGSVRFFQQRPNASSETESSPLSDREMEVLNLLAQGMANKQIAAALGITEHTAKFHVSSIYTKLNVTNRAEAVHQGVRQGLIAI
jgi:DNA-binding NarL/FixJ family response regulator